MTNSALPGAILVAALASLLLSPPTHAAAPPKSAVQFSAAATSAGEAELSRLMAAQPHTTVLTSPLSVEAALAMVGQGARGATLANMQSGLGLTAQGLTLPGAAAGYAALRQTLTGSSGVTLALANGVWVDRRVTLKPGFAQAEAGPFAARIASADFAAPSTLASINGFVSAATKGQIPEIVAQLRADSRVVLVNALYFKGAWARRFEMDETRVDPFTTAAGQTIRTPTMHGDGRFSYYETDAFQSVALPYKDPRFELVLVLMKAPGAAPAKGWTAALASQNYDQQEGVVALPKLDITWESDLVASLRSIGLSTALGPSADYGGMAAAPLAVGEVVHKTRLVVDEEGTVGAAATAVEMVVTACPPPGCGPEPFRFIADRPFWLLLRERTTGAPIFLGYVAAPQG
jgi:serpin B